MRELDDIMIENRSIKSEDTPLRLLHEKHFSLKALAYLWKILEKDCSVLFVGDYTTNLDKVRACLEFFEDRNTYTSKVGFKDLPQDTANELLSNLDNEANSIHLTLREHKASDALSRLNMSDVNPHEMFDVIVVNRSFYKGNDHIPRNVKIAELSPNENVTIKDVFDRDPRTDEWKDYVESSELLNSDEITDVERKEEQLGKYFEEIDTIGEFYKKFPY